MAETNHREPSPSEQETALRTKIEKGGRATIASEEISEAVTALEKQCFDTFVGSGPHDSAGHQACLLYMKVLRDVQTRFETAITSGKTAQESLLKFTEEKLPNERL